MKKRLRPINQMHFHAYFSCDASNAGKETDTQQETKTHLTLTSVGPGLEGAAGRLVSSLAGMTFTSSVVACPAEKA